MDELDDIIKEFLVESYENLDQLDRDLLILEDTPDDRDRLSSVFRTIHTIKGTCGFLGFPILEQVAHVGESLLVRLRDGELRLDQPIANGLLAMVDAIRTILSNIEAVRSEGNDTYDALKLTLEDLRQGKPAAARAKPAATSSSSGKVAAATGRKDAGTVQVLVDDETSESVSAESLDSMVEDLTRRPAKPRASRAKSTSKSAAKSPAKPKAEKVKTAPKAKPKATSKSAGSKVRGKKTSNTTEVDQPTVEVRVSETIDCLESMVEDLTQAPKKSARARSSKKNPPKAKSEPAKAKPKTAPKARRAPVKKQVTPETVDDDQVEDVVTEEITSEVVVQPVAVDPSESETESRTEAVVTPRKDQSPPQASNPPADGEGPAEGSEKNHALTESTVRLPVALLDRMMNLVGELVLARNQLLQFGQASQDADVIAASQRLNLITTELQEEVMKTRMQPIRNAWNKLPRVVRDLAQSCGKKVNVEMEGADTELDKTILEAIKDPLTHIVRNSVDHGIEPPEVRVARGKPAEGTLLLRAFHEGGQVNIEICDNGGGIPLDRVRAKAVEKGLVTTEQAAAMSDHEAMQLILLPGFSTAPKVTNVSGRGVGMDVVKTNVERIGGTLAIHSVTGQGTTLQIKIPLTLAIVPALAVKCGGDRYCVPQVNLLKLVRLDGERARSEIETMHSVPVHRLRGRLLPLVYLDEALGIRPQRTEAERRQAKSVNIVVLQAENRQFGLVVDQITDTQEIVVKPLGQHLKGLATYAGSTILGDGTVSLILDVIGIARLGHVLSEHGGRPLHEAVAAKGDSSGTQNSYLIVDPGDGSRAAIPTSSVARLEKFRCKQLEHSDREIVVQYRGQIMPLIPLDPNFGGDGMNENATLSVVVFHNGQRDVGIIVGRIVDIVDHVTEAGTEFDASSKQIINGRVTKIVDLLGLAS